MLARLLSFLEALGGQSISLPCPASGSHHYSEVSASFFHLQRQQRFISLYLTFMGTSSTDWPSSLPPSSHFKDPSDYIGPMEIFQDNLPILRSAISKLNSNCNLNCSLPCNLTHSRFLGLRHRNLWRTIILPTTIIKSFPLNKASWGL